MKKTIMPVKLISNGNLATATTLNATNIQFLDGICYQISWSNLTGTGALSFEGRVHPDLPWVSLDEVITPISLTGASGSHIIDLSLLQVADIRPKITNVSSLTGSFDLAVCSKSLGA